MGKKKKSIISLLIIPALALCAAAAARPEEDKDSGAVNKIEEIAVGVLKAPLKLTEGVLGFDLGKLVVTPTKYERYLKDVTVSTSVVDSADFKEGVFYDASEPLDRINSVRIERYGTPGQSASPVIRGMTGSRVLVMVDGIPYNAPSLGEADLSNILLGKVERIEVVRGPYSSLYGANAVGGVVNIITKDVPEKTRVRTDYSFGSWNTHNVLAEYGSRIGKVGFDTILQYLSTEGERTHSSHSALDATSKIKCEILEDVSVALSTNYYLAKTEHPGAKPPIRPELRTGTQVLLGNEESSSLFDYGSTNRIHLSSELKVKNLSANYYYLRWDDNDHRKTIDFFTRDKIRDEDEFKTYVYGMEYKYVQPIFEIDTVTMGASFSRKKFKVKNNQFNEDADLNTLFGVRDSQRSEWAVYGENEFSLYPFRVITGLRRDNPSDFDSRWSPKISGSLDLGFGIKLLASAARAYRAPTLNDLNWPQDEFGEGNAGLRPEKTRSWEIGAEKVFGDTALFRATYFSQKTEDVIVWAPVGTLNNWGIPRWRPTNFNKLTTHGIELESHLKLVDDINLEASYTYLDPVEVVSLQYDQNNAALFSESRRIASFIPRHQTKLGGEWRDAFGLKGLSLNTFLNTVSSRRNYYAFYAPFPGTDISYPKKVLDHYVVWDAKASYAYKNVEFFVAFNNILNEGYAKFGSAVNDMGYPQPGFSVTGGVSAAY